MTPAAITPIVTPAPTPTVIVTTTPTTIITPTPTPDINDISTWKNYENKTLGFTLKYPNSPNWNILENASQLTILNYIIDPAGGSDYDAVADKGKFKIEISNSNQFKNCDLWLIEYSKTEDQITGKTPNIKSLKQITNQNYTGISFENETTFGTFGFACINIPQGGTTHYSGWLDYPNNKTFFTKILSTFKFTGSATAKYTCPASGWVDCMPVLDEAKKIACSTEAMNWYKANCPNFQGGAL